MHLYKISLKPFMAKVLSIQNNIVSVAIAVPKIDTLLLDLKLSNAELEYYKNRTYIPVKLDYNTTKFDWCNLEQCNIYIGHRRVYTFNIKKDCNE